MISPKRTSRPDLATLENQPKRPHLMSILQRAKRRSWCEVAWQFCDERECLASFLAMETAEVLAGIKPANLIRIANRTQPCGRNLYRLWQRFGTKMLKGSALNFYVLRSSSTEHLLLFYDRDLLQRRLSGRTGAAFLRRCGYRQPGSLEDCLRQLRQRFKEESIPHEVGIFLGYPLKDVTAFMGWTDRPASCQRDWKIFGKTHRSVALAETFAHSRTMMIEALQQGVPPLALLDQSVYPDRKKQMGRSR